MPTLEQDGASICNLFESLISTASVSAAINRLDRTVDCWNTRQQPTYFTHNTKGPYSTKDGSAQQLVRPKG